MLHRPACPTLERHVQIEVAPALGADPPEHILDFADRAIREWNDERRADGWYEFAEALAEDPEADPEDFGLV